MTMSPKRLGALGATLSAAALLSGCAYNEALGRNQLLLVNDTSLAQSGALAWNEMVRTTRISRDPTDNARVRDGVIKAFCDFYRERSAEFPSKIDGSARRASKIEI